MKRAFLRTLASLSTCLITASANSLPIITDGLVAYYDFEGNALDTANTAVNHHGTLHGATIGADGAVGQAAYFDGSGDYIQTSTFSDTWSNWTTSFYIKPVDTSSGYQMILERERIGHYQDLDIAIRSDGRLQIETDSSLNTGMLSNASMQSNEWQHVAVTYDGSEQKIYIDGAFEESSVIQQTNAHVNIAEPLNIGRHVNASYPSYFEGGIDEIGIWDRALNATEVEIINDGFITLNELDLDLSSNVTQFWYEDNYALDFENPIDSYVDAYIDGLMDLGEEFYRAGAEIVPLALTAGVTGFGMVFTTVTSSPGPLYEQWVSEVIQTSSIGRVTCYFDRCDMTSASPSVLYLDNINFDDLIGLSFDYESFDISADDLFVIKSGDDIIYQLLGEDILSGGEVFASLAGLSGYSDLSIGLYSNEANHKFSLSDLAFYLEDSSSVPEPSSLALLIIGLSGLLFGSKRAAA